MKYLARIIILAVSFLTISTNGICLNINKPSQDYYNNPDTVLYKVMELKIQHQFQEIIKTIESGNLNSSPKNETEFKLLLEYTDALFATNQPKSYLFLEKILDYSIKHHTDSLQALTLIKYSSTLKYRKPLLAFSFIQRSISILNNTKYYYLQTQAYQQLASSYISQGKYNLGITPLHQSLALIKKRSIGSAAEKQHIFSNLASAYNILGHADSGLYYSNLAYQIIQSADSIDMLSRIKVMNNLSTSLKLNGNIDSSIVLRQQTNALIEKHFPENSFQLGGNYYHLAYAYADNNNLDSAMYYIQKALFTNYPHETPKYSHDALPSSIVKTNSINSTLQSLMLKIYILETAYNNTQEPQFAEIAIHHYQSMDTLVDILQRTVSLDNLPMLIKLNRQGYDAALKTISDYEKNNPSVNYLDLTYHFATATKAKTLAYQLNNMKIMASEADSLLQIQSKLENELTALNIDKQSSTMSSDSMDVKVLKKKLELFYVIDQNAHKNSNHYIPTPNTQPINIHTIQNNLSSNEALIEYVVGDDELFTFVCTTDTIILQKSAYNQQATDVVKGFLRSLKTGLETDNTLSDLLITPIYHLVKEKSNLIFVPDGELFNIPFEALNTPDNNHPLILDHAVSYNYSARLWLQSKLKSSGKIESWVAFAPGFLHHTTPENYQNAYRHIDADSYNEIFSGEKNNLLSPLPFSLEEVKSIGQLFQQNSLSFHNYIGASATETQFRQASPTSIMHIATHGYSSKHSPGNSGLFFYRDEAPGTESHENDDFLFINELFEMEIQSDLVVLSACKSGTGRIMKGEGVFSLPRGFIFAGVPNLVASLWKIHDEKTMELMKVFYQQLLENNITYAEALRRAKIKMIQNGQAPIDWASLVLIGK